MITRNDCVRWLSYDDRARQSWAIIIPWESWVTIVAWRSCATIMHNDSHAMTMCDNHTQHLVHDDLAWRLSAKIVRDDHRALVFFAHDFFYILIRFHFDFFPEPSTWDLFPKRHCGVHCFRQAQVLSGEEEAEERGSVGTDDHRSGSDHKQDHRCGFTVPLV